ncbi:FIST N-terminal domain-containing protein [Candidatus Albibeggiatoa sp. nov. NOAA]|uniref:FIST signal transduction protein n=1 Tax=Candidatus Albibeggiatoa sp. nov. NOAA TaxID=3162724 RepID=UPI0032F75FC4|nr:FIST C-terminal domain-containing protein [Thiotrichaceae bacterium]
MLKAVIGHSEDVDSRDAILEVLEQCQRKLAGYTPQAGILFSAIDYEHTVILETICQTYPNIELIGCTTDGELSSQLGFTEDAISLILFYSNTIEIKAGLGHHLLESPADCAVAAYDQAMAKLSVSPSFCLTFPDGLLGVKDIALDALQKQLGNKVPIYGGMAGEQAELKNTYQFYQSKSYSNAMPILIFGGNIQFAHGVASGWKTIGKKAQITKAIGNEVFEINHQPALEFYHHYLGAFTHQSREFPIAIFEAEQDKFYIRAIFNTDRNNKSLVFNGKIPENALIQIAEATRDNLLEGAKQSIAQALEEFSAKPEIGLIFSCAARKAILGTKTKHEFDLVQDYASQQNFPVIGFYAYGEICPVIPPAPTRLHNGTFVTLILGS